MTRLLVLALAGLALAACAHVAPGPAPGAPAAPRAVPAPAPAPVPPLAEQLHALESRILVHVEEARAKLDAGTKPLAVDPELTAAARAHSAAMAARKAFDAGSADTNVAIERLAASPDFQGYVGENSAMEYFTPGRAIDPDAYAKAFVAQWLASPAHKKTLGYRGYDSIGIGVAANGNEIYAAQLFAAHIGVKRTAKSDGNESDPQ